IAIILIIGVYFIFFNKSKTYQFVTVENGSISESVSLTGNTTPEQSVSLTFGSGGPIAHTYSDLGKKVSKGQKLAELITSDLVAQLHQAQASHIVAQTTYDKLVNGASTTDIEVAKVALNNAKNSYNNIISQQKVLVANAFSSMLNSGIIAQPTVSGVSTADLPIISGTYIGTEEGIYTVTIHMGGNNSFFSFSGIEKGSGQVSTVAVPLGTLGLYIQFPSNNITSYSNNTWIISIPNKQSPSYLTYYNAYQSALQNQSNSIATAQGVVDTAQANLDQRQAVPRSEDLEIAKAQIGQAQANIESIKSKLENAEIVAPISGTITQFDAKIGQIASPSMPLVSIMSDGGYEVDSGASETDIGKISVGDKVSMTIDAFQNEIFLGSVFYIAPAATNTGGVITYQVKISFDKIDLRLKSGLTANINIETKHKDNVLVLPQYAILQNDKGTFVETLVNNKIIQNPVTLGIVDQKGNVEIISGVVKGEQVLNIGLKAS
ncbi:MAG: efflux RND transporter periplasmic adaptor subunit, partial [bacterium]